MTSSFEPTSRTTVRRRASRARYDKQIIYQILDEALIASVAIVRDGLPEVRPMIHGRVGDELILHSHVGNALLSSIASGCETCINVTLIDGLVLAREIADHTMLYRSVMIYGRGREVTDPAQKLALMKLVFARLVRSGRFERLPPLSGDYLQGTRLLSVPLDECVAKVNDIVAPPSEPSPRIWSGTIPLRLAPGAPVPDELTRAQQLVPGPELENWGGQGRGA